LGLLPALSIALCNHENIDGGLYDSFGRIDDDAWLCLYGVEWPDESEEYARALVGDYDETKILTDKGVQEMIYRDMKQAMNEYKKGYGHYYYMVYDQNGKELGFFF